MRRISAILPTDLYDTGTIKTCISEVTSDMLQYVEEGLGELCGDLFKDAGIVRRHFLSALEDCIETVCPEENVDGRSSQDAIRTFGNILRRMYGVSSHIDKGGALVFGYGGTTFRIENPLNNDCISLHAVLERDGMKADFFTGTHAVGATLVTGCLLPEALAKADFVHRRILADMRACRILQAVSS